MNSIIYYFGTNKLQRVTGSGTQYTYDHNGNMTTDDLNSNYDIIYDHRNLILELKKLVIDINGSRNDTTIYHTFYYYDEAGNRIRKMIYNNYNDSLLSDNIYSRDVSGRELAIYENGSIDQWNIYGMDNIGFIDGNEDIRFYMKDHLGSVRAVTDVSGNVVSSQDYDAWGYLLENRVYDSDVSVYKFTSKERDEESFYDYFGARYYDARVGRWGQVEPLLEKYINVSPYCYGLNNPIYLLDIDGMDLFVGGDKTAALNDIRSLFSSVEIQQRIIADDNGLVSFDVNGLDLSSDAALELVNNLVTSENIYLFEVSDETKGFFRNGRIHNFDLSKENGYANLSITERNIDNGTGHEDLIPKDNYSGQVTFGTGYWTIPVKGSNIKENRWNMVFHELSENYYRTDKKQPYRRIDDSGAHLMAISAAKRFKRNTSIKPGWFGKYVP